MIGLEAKEYMALALTYRKKLYDNGWDRATNDDYRDALIASMEICLYISKNDLGRNQEKESTRTKQLECRPKISVLTNARFNAIGFII